MTLFTELKRRNVIRMAWLIAENLASSITGAVMRPSMGPIRCEPRFVAIIRKLATTGPRFDAVCAVNTKGSGP